MKRILFIAFLFVVRSTIAETCIDKKGYYECELAKECDSPNQKNCPTRKHIPGTYNDMPPSMIEDTYKIGVDTGYYVGELIKRAYNSIKSK